MVSACLLRISGRIACFYNYSPNSDQHCSYVVCSFNVFQESKLVEIIWKRVSKKNCPFAYGETLIFFQWQSQCKGEIQGWPIVSQYLKSPLPPSKQGFRGEEANIVASFTGIQCALRVREYHRSKHSAIEPWRKFDSHYKRFKIGCESLRRRIQD